MSSRRNNSQQTMSEDEINELISRLQSLLSETRQRNTTTRASSSSSSSKLYKEACSYLKSLQREMDHLSERLSELLATMDNNSAQAEIIRTLLGSP